MNTILAKIIRIIEQDYKTHIFTDKTYLKAIYFLAFGEKLNLREPKTLNEKNTMAQIV